MNNRRKTLPPIDPKTDPKLRPLLEALKEITETGDGVRGDPMDRKLTIRDLVDAGLARLKPGSMTEFGPADDEAIDNDPPGSTLIPPRPTGFNAIGSFGYIVLSWDIPGDQYLNHAFTNIYRSETDNFANAEMIGRDTGMMYTDHVREVEEEGAGFYYWITFTSTEDREGPANSTSGTYAEVIPDLGFLLDRLSGEIDESVLAESLRTEIQRIEFLDMDISNLETGLSNESQVREAEDSALAQSISIVSAKVSDNAGLIRQEQTARADADGALAQTISTVGAKADDNAGAIQREQTARADADGALAEQVTTVQSQLGENIASVQQSMSTNIKRIDGELVNLGAEYTLKLDVNGYVSGFGAYNDGRTSDFAVVADRFWVAPPNSTGKRKPFIIQNNKVYIDTAFIRNASIQEGQLGPISFGKITDSRGNPVTTVAGKLKGELIEADNLSVAEAAKFYGDVFSNNYQSGVRGWAIRQSGTFEFNQGRIRSSVQIGNTTAGDIIQSAGSIDNWKRPGSTLIDGNKIYAADAYVDTISIKGQAVTIPVASYSASPIGYWQFDRGWKTLASVWIDPQGGQVQILVSCLLATSAAYSSNGTLGYAYLRVLENGGVIWEGEVVRTPGGTQGRTGEGGNIPSTSFEQTAPITVALLRPGSWGVKNYYFQVSLGGVAVGGEARNRFISATGMKR